mmetsp:Transcript_59883/g.106500  ORF Transcript_59883/g.106500 Transcript_59883/m.106500 type:complete len:268 (-) Transcript_59883:1610-2413(-)
MSTDRWLLLRGFSEERLLRLRKADAGFGSGSPERLLLLRKDDAELGFGSGSPERLLLLRIDAADCGGGRRSSSASSPSSSGSETLRPPPDEMLLRLRRADGCFGSGSPEMLLLLRMADAGFGSGSPEMLLLLREGFFSSPSGGEKEMLLLLRMFPDPEAAAGRLSCSSLSATGSVLAERDPGAGRALAVLELCGEPSVREPDAEPGRRPSSPPSGSFSESISLCSSFLDFMPFSTLLILSLLNPAKLFCSDFAGLKASSSCSTAITV